MKNLRIPVLLMSASLLGNDAARAAALVFDDTSPNETISVFANDFEGGLAVNGNLMQQGLNNPASVTLPENGPISFSGTWIDNGLNAPTTRTIYLVEPFAPTQISDIFSYTITPNTPGGGFATIQGSFLSDDEGSLGTLPSNVNPGDVFVENGQAVPFFAAFLTGQISSDFEVPEPNAVSLGLMALLGVGGFKLRRQLRRNAA